MGLHQSQFEQVFARHVSVLVGVSWRDWNALRQGASSNGRPAGIEMAFPLRRALAEKQEGPPRMQAGDPSIVSMRFP
jgi:hypothetical protein